MTEQSPPNSEPKPELARIVFPGKIHLVETNEQLQEAAHALAKATHLGFDTETRPSFRKGEVHKVALLQLSTDEDAYIIRLHPITQFAPVKAILENQNILKVGVAIRDDLKNLQKLFAFNPQNFVELQNLAKEKGLKNFGLKGMAEEVLQGALSKGPKLTNWEARPLTDQQLMYAATDAWIGLRLFQKLQIETPIV